MRKAFQFPVANSGSASPGMVFRAKRGAIFWAKSVQSVLLVAIAVTMLGAVHSQYERVGGQLMCACGCGQMLLECNHLGCPDSPGMIRELHAQVASGASDKAILAWFATKYGATVLAAPIRGGFDDVAWIMPFGIFVAAIAGTFVIVWIWKRRQPASTGYPPAEIATNISPHEAALRDRIRRETEY
ncbi:MAG TPA: cytochrome c-type biogenesis protein CcmH [Acidobacteriaceae bacterium]|nr:cytochrome c-type biogenesis protein CcmH [Acidobacteriaceae bacterium]